jgi:hypothetical protein
MRRATNVAIAQTMTTASAFAGAPVRLEASPSLERKPSRVRAKRIRDPAVAVPSALANARIDLERGLDGVVPDVVEGVGTDTVQCVPSSLHRSPPGSDAGAIRPQAPVAD